MKELKLIAGIKSREREQIQNKSKNKSFSDFDWGQLITMGTHAKLTVYELNTYLKHFSLSNIG